MAALTPALSRWERGKTLSVFWRVEEGIRWIVRHRRRRGRARRSVPLGRGVGA